MKEITKEYLNNSFNNYESDNKNRVLRHALVSNTIQSVVESNDNFKDTDFEFNLDIKTMSVTNQKASGRCWIFSALNVLRESIAKKLNVSEFELSQNFVGFYDKLEKINYELEAIIDLIGCEPDDRTLNHILTFTIGDGGQWDMLVNIINKYGIVPKNVFNETVTSEGTSHMNFLIDVELRKFASRINDLFKEGGMDRVRKEKDNLLDKMYHLLLSVYGIPPKSFDLEYKDNNNEYHKVESLTPLSFYEEYVKDEVNDYVSLINSPTSDKPFNKSYTVKYLGNVIEGKIVKHLNVTMDRMVELILKQLKDNRIVWFGSDVSFYRNREKYYWDDKQYDYESAFGLSFKCDKGAQLDYRISAMGHAMCITGVMLDKEGKPVKWKIENSWGENNGKKGYYLMSDSWFNLYVYQAVVDKKYLSKEEFEQYNSEPIMLKPWDPMGTLA